MDSERVPPLTTTTLARLGFYTTTIVVVVIRALMVHPKFCPSGAIVLAVFSYYVGFGGRRKVLILWLGESVRGKGG